MDRSEVLTLISITYTTDALKQKIPVETTRPVFCNVQSVGRAEFFTAGQAGLKPEYVCTMLSTDYNGEKIVSLRGERFAVYRTYLRQNEQIELYLERRVGT